MVIIISFFRSSDVTQLQEWSHAFQTLALRKHIHFVLDVNDDRTDCLMALDAEKMERVYFCHGWTAVMPPYAVPGCSEHMIDTVSRKRGEGSDDYKVTL